MKEKGFIKILSVIISVLVIGGLFFVFSGENRNDFSLEKIVYVRSLEVRDGSYWATVDNVENLLAEPSAGGDNARVFESVQFLKVRPGTKAYLLSGDSLRLSVFDSLLEEQPVYTNTVFQIQIDAENSITKIIEQEV